MPFPLPSDSSERAHYSAPSIDPHPHERLLGDCRRSFPILHCLVSTHGAPAAAILGEAGFDVAPGLRAAQGMDAMSPTQEREIRTVDYTNSPARTLLGHGVR